MPVPSFTGQQAPERGDSSKPEPRWRRLPWVTAGLVLVQVAVYGAARAAGPMDVDGVVRLGGKVGPLIVEVGEVWRLLSANLVHRDGVHLGLNLLALVAVGSALERRYRRVDCAALLVAAGLGTMSSSLVWAQAPSVGASGLACGGLGALLAAEWRYRERLPRSRLVGEGALPTVLAFLWLGWTAAGVDGAGHLGGLAMGLVLGTWLPPRALAQGLPPAWRWGRTLGALVLGVGVAAAAVEVRSGWRTEQDDAFGVSVVLPRGWQRGADPLGPLVFSNGLPRLGRATFAAEALEAGEPGDGVLQARHFQESWLGPGGALVQQGRVRVEALEPVQVGGRSAQRLRAVVERPGGEPVRLVALFVPRGEVVYQLVFSWPEAFGRYAQVVERMVEGLRFGEPEELRRARARALLVPGAVGPMRELGRALRRWGQPEEAVEVLAAAVRRAPEEVGTRAELARALLEVGRVEEGCEAARQALVYTPLGSPALEAAVRCELARGEVHRALQRLEEARQAGPLEPRLQAVAEALRAAAGGLQ